MPGPKANEREGTRAVLRHARVSAYKVREVIDAIRGKPVHEAADLLRFVERDCGVLVEKLLRSAVSNASNNDGLDADELYVSACFVDEGPTAKRWRPRARGRATRLRKRSCHVTVIVSRLPEHQLVRLQARRRAENLAMRARRVEATRRARAEAAEGASRRERRHPEAFPAPTEGQADEGGTAPVEDLAAEDVTSAAPGPAAAELEEAAESAKSTDDEDNPVGTAGGASPVDGEGGPAGEEKAGEGEEDS